MPAKTSSKHKSTEWKWKVQRWYSPSHSTNTIWSKNWWKAIAVRLDVSTMMTIPLQFPTSEVIFLPELRVQWIAALFQETAACAAVCHVTLLNATGRWRQSWGFPYFTHSGFKYESDALYVVICGVNKMQEPEIYGVKSRGCGNASKPQ